MSYSPTTNPPAAITLEGMNSTLPKIWIYVSTDSDLSGSYFSDGVQRGMKINDVILGIDMNGNTIKTYRVTALAAFNSNNPLANRVATTTAGYQVGN